MQRNAAFLLYLCLMKLTVSYIEIPQSERDLLPLDAMGEKSPYISTARLTMNLALAIIAKYPNRKRLFLGLPEFTDFTETETPETPETEAKKRGRKPKSDNDNE